MIPASFVPSTLFTWSRLPHNQGCELKMGDEVVGTLRRPGIWSCRYEVASPQGNWAFRQVGFLRTEIIDSATQQRIGEFKPSWSGGGTLRFLDGQTFHITCKGLWRPLWTVSPESGEPFLRLHTREKVVELSESSVHVGNARDSRISLLIMFTLFRIRQAEEDAAMAVVASVMVVG